MKWYSKIIRRILKGIVLFVLPLMLTLFLFKKAVVLVRSLFRPLKAHLPEDSVFGIGMITLLSVLVILLISYLAGVWADKKGFKSFLPFVENNILVLIPGYTLLKSQAEDAVDTGAAKRKAVLIGEEGDWKFGIEIENHPDGYSAVFFPEPPDGKSGEIKLIHTSKLKHLDIHASSVVNIARKYGQGAAALADQIEETKD